MTIGDVLAAIAAIVALGATWAATVLLVALAFPTRTRRAQETLTASPGACLARGMGVALLLLVIAGTLGRHPAGPVRLLSYALWACLGALASLGSAGIARLIGARIQGVGAAMSPFASLTRGALVYATAGFLPIIGWFLITPIALLLSVGCAVTALHSRGSRSDVPVQNDTVPPPRLGGASEVPT